METILEKCKVGDRGFVWCCGWNNWDNQICEIIKIGILVKVKYSNGRTREFFNDARFLKTVKIN